MKYLFFVVVTGLFVLAPSALAYDSGTHAFLTSSAIDLYNKSASLKFPAELKDYFVDGVVREDDIPRSFNHFYDPVFKRGLTYNPVINAVNLPGQWETSKAWAEDGKNQNSLVYKITPTIASILSVVERGKISEISADSDFTWQRAIELYKAGKKEEAMFALGHVVHLIEDASVPDHTRNDPHPGGSPYESFAAKFTLQAPDVDLAKRLNGKPSVVLSDLGSYFDGIATYSNNNFYSRNTIGLQSGYNMPIADMSDLDVRDGKYYVMGHDGEGNEYPLLKKSSILSLLFDIKNITVTVDDDIVKGSYWSLLSTKAVQYAAGVLDLFFKTAKAAEVVSAQSVALATSGERGAIGAPLVAILQPVVFTDRSVVTIGEKVIESGEHFTPLGQVALIFDLPNGKSATSNVQADDTGAFQNVYQMPLNAAAGAYAYYARDLTTGAVSGKVMYSVVLEIKKVDPAVVTASSSVAQDKGKTSTKASPPTVHQCKFDEDGPLHTPIILNEVAWMGGSETYGLNSSDEWFELKNVTGATVDLSGWQIVNKKGTIQLIFPSGAVLSPWGFYLLERTDDNSVPNISADLTYTGGLANTDDGLEIFDANCRPIDLVLADPDWPAGDAALRRTMERKEDFSWYTSGSFNGKVFGTPRSPNGPAYVPQNQVVYVGGSGGGNQNNSSNDTSATSSPDLMVSEVMYDPPGTDGGHEWVEILNGGTTSVEMSNVKFREGGTNHNLALEAGSSTLAAGGYAIIANGTSTFLEDFPNFNGMLFSASFSLSNSGEELALRYGDTLFGAVTYASTTGAYGDGNSLQLIDGSWTWSRPTPGAANVFDQSLVSDASSSTASSTPPVAGSGTDHIVISEVQVGGVDAGDEFIELYNPSEHNIDLSGWSLQYLSGSAEEVSSSTVFKEVFGAEDLIRSKGFFLIAREKNADGNDGYAGTTLPDHLYRSFGLSGGSNGGAVLLVSTSADVDSLSAESIESGLFYGSGSILADLNPAAVPESAGSLERKAFRDAYCLSGLPGTEGEFLGNNCETGSSAVDFEARVASKPQNSQSLPEPRTAPTVPLPLVGESAIARYDFDGMVIDFAWSPSRDASDSPSGIVYVVYEDRNLSSPLLVATTSATFIYPISEIGKVYRFSMVALDRDGMLSATSSWNVEAPLPVSSSSVVFSQSTLPSSSAGSHYSDNWYQLGRGFSGTLHALILRGLVDRPEFSVSHIYLKEFEDKEYTHEIASFTLSDNAPFTNAVHNVVLSDVNVEFHPFSYYRLDTYQDYQNRSVILLGTTATGTAMSNSFIVDTGEVFNYYPFYPFMVMEGEPGPPVDVSLPQHPTVPSLNLVSFDQSGMTLAISWASSTDLDSLDSALTYEYNITPFSDFNDIEWKSVGPNLSLSYPVSFPNKYTIGVRAVDDAGFRSDVASTTWEFPADFSSSEIRLEISSAGFSPSTFAVRAGSSVTISLVGADDETHVLKFDDPSIELGPSGVGPSMTRTVTLNVPRGAGTYTFRCDVPGHTARGETGTMVVQ